MPENTSDVKFPMIRTLICGFMRLSWEDVLKLTNIFTHITELRVPFNKINHINLPPQHYLNALKLLDFEGNELKEWSEINKLSVLTNLEQLNVTNTSIKCINMEEIDYGDPFPNLKQLVISENLIDNVSDTFNVKLLRYIFKFFVSVGIDK